MSKNAPRDARELVGKGDGEHVVMQPRSQCPLELHFQQPARARTTMGGMEISLIGPQ